VFLQSSVEVKGAPAIGRKSTYPSPIVLLDSLGSVALGVAFHAHPFQSTLIRRQTIFPRHEGTFPAILLPLLGKEQPLQLDGYHM
jgi:hypothetical protein